MLSVRLPRPGLESLHQPGPEGHESQALGRTGRSRSELGPCRQGRLTTWSKERGKRQSQFGKEMQSHEVSGGNAYSPEASNMDH